MAKKKSSKKKLSQKSHKYKLIYLFSLFVLIVGIVGFLNTKNWYFLSSSKEKVDFQNQTGDYQKDLSKAYINNNFIDVPDKKSEISKNHKNDSLVLGDSSLPKRIEVDLTNQRIYAFEGNNKIYDFPVSTGKPWWATPTGTYKIWIKLRYTRMAGGSKALGTYYDLPNVPYTMFFYNQFVPKWKGYGIHGAYWHNNFGQPMSHGCVNMKEEDVAQLYYWAEPNLNDRSSILATEENPGTTVIIYGKTPGS